MRSLFVLFCFIAAGSLFAAQQGSSAPFQLSVQPETPSVASGDKIVLRIILTNNSEKDLGVRQKMRPDQAEWDYSIDVRDEKGNAVAQTNYGRNRLDMVKLFSVLLKIVNPAHSLEEKVTLSKLYDMTMPGRYTVQVSRHVDDRDSGQLVKSNPATIDVN